MLMDDGRISCADIANKIGQITQRTVRYRLKGLVKDGFIKIRAITNPIAVGYTVIADVFIETEPGMISEVANTLAKFECVSYVACSTGDRDISIQIVARNNAEAYAFVTEVLGKVVGVRKTTTSIVPVILKDVYDWHIPKSTV
jgi:Lrp/AsnC family transcriptional regulator for asnA, asnC and gidA